MPCTPITARKLNTARQDHPSSTTATNFPAKHQPSKTNQKEKKTEQKTGGGRQPHGGDDVNPNSPFSFFGVCVEESQWGWQKREKDTLFMDLKGKEEEAQGGEGKELRESFDLWIDCDIYESRRDGS
jgi:hypothetical protein